MYVLFCWGGERDIQTDTHRDIQTDTLRDIRRERHTDTDRDIQADIIVTQLQLIGQRGYGCLWVRRTIQIKKIQASKEKKTYNANCKASLQTEFSVYKHSSTCLEV